MSGYSNITGPAWGNDQGNLTWAGGSPPPMLGPPDMKGGLNQPWMGQGFQPGKALMPLAPPMMPGMGGPNMVSGGGGHSGAFGGMGHQQHMTGGFASGSYTQPDDAPPPIPGAPIPRSQLTPMGTNRGYASDPLQGLNTPPPRAWSGGHFMPGQSAIVGDKPDGAPGPNAEVVTAIPGGGFTVTPNPKNMHGMPRFADGGIMPPPVYQDQPDSLAGMRAPMPASPPPMPVMEVSAPGHLPQWTPQEVYQDQQKQLIEANSGLARRMVRGVDSAFSGVAGIPAWMSNHIGAPIEKFFNGDEDAINRARQNIEAAKQPGFVPPGMNGIQPNAGKLTPDEPPSADSLPPARIQPNTSGSTPDDPPTAESLPEAAPPPFWTTEQVQTYANNPIPANHPRTAEEENAILQGWQDQANPPPPGMPPGLSPVAQQAFVEQYRHLSNTKAGRAQIMQGEIAKQGVLSKEARTLQGRKDMLTARYQPQTVQTPNGAVTTIMGHQINGPKPPAVISPDAQQEDLGNGITRITHGKNIYIHDPEIPGAPVLEGKYHAELARVRASKAKEIASQHIPAGIVESSTPGVYVAHDGKGGQKLMTHDGNDFVPLGKQTHAPAAKEEFDHYHTGSVKDGTFKQAKFPKGMRNVPAEWIKGEIGEAPSSSKPDGVVVQRKQ